LQEKTQKHKEKKMKQLFVTLVFCALLFTVFAARDVNLCSQNMKECVSERPGSPSVTTMSSHHEFDLISAAVQHSLAEVSDQEEQATADQETSSMSDSNMKVSVPVTGGIVKYFTERCITSCEWFGSSEPFCTKCARPMIVYPRHMSVNSQCYTLPDAIQKNQITLDAVNDIKDKCAKLGGCTCTATKITNALTIRLLKRAVLSTTREFIEIVRRNITDVAFFATKDATCSGLVNELKDISTLQMDKLEIAEMLNCRQVAPKITNDSQYRQYLKDVYIRVQGIAFESVTQVKKKLGEAKCFVFQKFFKGMKSQDSVLHFLNRRLNSKMKVKK